MQLTFLRIAFVFMNDHKASEDLHSFAKLNQDRLYKLLKTCFNPQTDIKTLGKSSVRSVPIHMPISMERLTLYACRPSSCVVWNNLLLH